jgi:pyridoxal/pyridoxine/pyridoxamine kinase
MAAIAVKPARVLSVQSHVVHGVVGNRAAVFPLQLLGMDVDAIHTVHLACHMGYPATAGTRLAGTDLEDIVAALRSNDLMDYTHLLTGREGEGHGHCCGTLPAYAHTSVDTHAYAHESRRALCAGYIGTASMLTALADLVRELKRRNPDLIYGSSHTHTHTHTLTHTLTHTQTDAVVGMA